MRFSTAELTFALLVLANGDLASAAPAHGCSNPVIRKEWRTLSTKEQQNFLTAVKCLKTQPGKTQSTYAGVRSRYDDFQALHINRTDFIHFVGFFQPYHRTFLAEYEAALRNECGYQGAHPYWDWTLDAVSEEAFVASPIFHPENGFGGNGPFVDSSNDTTVRLHIPGKTGGGCVQDGPFKDMPVNMGPGLDTSYKPHCLKRDFSPWLATQKLNSSIVDWTMDAKDYFEFDIRLEGGIEVSALTIHGGGHLGVGGELGEIGNVYSSPGDPLFFLHHANLDRIWYSWQKRCWKTRKEEIAGPDTQFTYPFDFFGTNAPYKNVTLDYVMDFGPLRDNLKVRDAMDPQGGALCYNYDKLWGY